MSKKKGGAKAKSNGAVATNPKARHDYEILETMEAGMVLTGSEVKSLRGGSASMRESFAIIRDGEPLLIGMHIGPYAQAGYAGHEPTRTRKLLLHKDEIKKLGVKTKLRGFTLIPLSVYFKKGKVKVELALVTHKKQHDKREAKRLADDKREIERAVKHRNRE